MTILKTMESLMCQIQSWSLKGSSWRKREQKSSRATRRNNTARCTTKVEFFQNSILRHMDIEDDILLKIVIFFMFPNCSRWDLPVCDLFPIHTNPKALLGIVQIIIRLINFINNKSVMTTRWANIVWQYARIKFLSK